MSSNRHILDKMKGSTAFNFTQSNIALSTLEQRLFLWPGCALYLCEVSLNRLLDYSSIDPNWFMPIQHSLSLLIYIKTVTFFTGIHFVVDFELLELCMCVTMQWRIDTANT